MPDSVLPPLSLRFSRLAHARDNRFSRVSVSFIFFLSLAFIAGNASAQTAVLTTHNDNSRDGQDTTETILTTSNVNTAQFGKLFSLPVDGQVYAQPLYVPAVTINGTVHNVLIVATENDSIYAFDADSNIGVPLWHASLIDTAHGANPGETPVSWATLNCTDLQPQIGITSTPVIDTTTNTIYVEAKSTDGTNYYNRLHSLDLLTGNEKSSGPVVITATVSGSGAGSTNGQITFDPLHQLNRPGLLLQNGTIYIGFAGHCDLPPYHGWLFAYDEATLSQKSFYITTPNGSDGGIWMSGAGISADSSGNIYVPTGNGTFDTTPVPPPDTGDSILKFGTTNQILNLLDYFTPFNQATLSSQDKDLGSGGVLLLPDQSGTYPHLLVQAGKEGRVYVLNRDQLTTNNTHYCSGCASDTNIVEETGAGAVGHVFDSPAYWNNNIYLWASGSTLKQIPISNGLPNFANMISNSTTFAFPGATPSISSNGTVAGTAILWAIDSSQYGSPGPGPGPAVLHAYDATNISKELWNSGQAANNRDQAGNAVKFTVPTISNGKVYIGTSTEVDVYGLLSPQQPPATPVISPGSESVTSPVNVTITDSTTGATIYYTLDGSTPSPTNGTVYTTAFWLTTSTTVRAMASSSVGNSPVASAVYTIESSSNQSINYSAGMTATGLTLNGSAKIVGSRLQLTDTTVKNEHGSAFVTAPINVQSFSTDFAFQLTSAVADGFTFTIENVGPTALGPTGGGLGYGPYQLSGTPGIGSSIAVKFDLYNNNGEGKDSTGQYADGASPTVPAVDLTPSGVDLHSGDVMNVHMTYDGTTLTMTITDATTESTFTTSWTVNIPGTVGGNTAYVGFTGGTGGYMAIQEILSWTYASGYSGSSQAPAITTQPANQTVTAGQTATFSVSATGTAPLSYQWQKNGANISGATASSYTTPPTTTADNGSTFQVIVSNSAGSVTSNAATLTVNSAGTAPSITTQPANQTVTAGQTATFSVSATGTAPLSYQWQENGTNISGATASSYTTPPTTTADNGSTFQVIVSNSAGSGTSNTATLTVNSTTPAVNFGTGFTSTGGLQFNGAASWNQSASRLRLTDTTVKNEHGSIFYTTPVNVQSFTNDFSFQFTSAVADGFTFTIENVGPTALGPTGGGLGYGPYQLSGTPGIGSSIAVKFDLYNNNGEGKDSTGQYADGASPTVPAVDLTPSGVDLHSGDVMNVHMTYDGTTLTMTITDATTESTFTTSWTVNIPGTVGGNTAYVGFTGGTGGYTAVQEILSWTFQQ